MAQITADFLAEAALAEIEFARGTPDRPMTIGLGAGQTAARAIRALAERYRSWSEGTGGGGQGLSFNCVAASESSETLARELGLPMTQFAVCESVDVLVDGADEVDGQMRVMKGSRGAVARERMLAWASRKNVYMVAEHKVSESIGTGAGLAIAVMAFGLGSVRASLREIGLRTVVRRTLNGDLFITDNGNLIVDAELTGGENLEELAAALNDVPGVVDHGLFLDEADVILVERKAALGHTPRIERLQRHAEGTR